MGQASGESAIQCVPVGEGDHQNVAGTALLGHDRHQSVSTEPDRRQPNVFGHGEKVPVGSAIVKSRCRTLSCLMSAVVLPVSVSPLSATRSVLQVRPSRAPFAVVFGLLLA